MQMIAGRLRSVSPGVADGGGPLTSVSSRGPCDVLGEHQRSNPLIGEWAVDATEPQFGVQLSCNALIGPTV